MTVAWKTTTSRIRDDEPETDDSIKANMLRLNGVCDRVSSGVWLVMKGRG
jgi:hypothetical protein